MSAQPSTTQSDSQALAASNHSSNTTRALILAAATANGHKLLVGATID